MVSHYCYAPTPLYAATALVTWRFGGDDVKDTDKDGVPDDKDQCNFTKEGVKVDANGCPFDTDKDGVIDDMDQCPNTAAGVVVDTAGCPMDTAAVDSAAAETAPADTSAADSSAADNCAAKETAPADSDGDGVLDANDKCPNTKQGAAVDSVGCALDSDKDGVADADDKCAETAAGVEVDETGCPRDFDKDGVADYMDKCPNTKAGATVDSVGCPKDSDFDGVPDGADKCENTENGVAVDASGCPLDSDKDGVPDHLDKCPNTLSGVKIDSVGCPLKKKEDLNKLKRGIRFKTNSTKLTKSSYGTLDDIIALLNKIPSANLEVQGHTDNVGKDDFNQKLSEARAQTVVDYFVKKGIDSSRVRAAGFGSKKPVASNKNAKGREKNRRVELVPFEK